MNPNAEGLAAGAIATAILDGLVSKKLIDGSEARDILKAASERVVGQSSDAIAARKIILNMLGRFGGR